MAKMENIKYEFFNKGLLRVPYFPIDYIKYIDDIDSLLSIEPFKEAIYVASPSLFEDLYVKGKRTEKVILSFIKYFIRACTRCTPFGLFAGCGILPLQNKKSSYIEIEQESEYKTYSRVDMEYLCDLIRILEQNQELRNGLTYHVNTTLYYVHKNIRYIEYSINNNKRKYSFSEAKLSDYLELVINKASLHPCTIEELANEITSDEITLFEAKDFINELIDNQILISELEPSVSGSDLIIQLKGKLNKLGNKDVYIDKIITLLYQSDKMQIGTRCNIYKEIDALLSNLFPYQKKNLLHIDCLIPSKNSFVGNEICNAVLKGFSILSHLTAIRENGFLSSFKEAFYKRYEEQEIPLVIALDTQVGVGFGNWKEVQGDINPLIDDLAIPSIVNQNSILLLDAVSLFLISKYEDCIRNNTYSINITNDDLKLFRNTILDNLPNQLYTMIKIIDMNEENSNVTIFMNSCSGPSSVNLLSRFGYLDKSINDFIKEIIDDESKFYQNKIVAEISHLPEDRIGNIQMHPYNREYEISYISNPHNIESNITCIPIEDIMVSVPFGQKIILRSKKYNKEIIPRLTTAHNYSNGLPIYCFLCNIQLQNSQDLFFDWGPSFNTKQFLPRVIYENIILSRAKWRLNSFDLPKQNNVPFDDYYVNLITWKNSKGIPDLVEIVEYDNTLLIDFSKKSMVKIFINHIMKRKACLLEEYLFAGTKHPFVARGDSYFTNELILCLHKI